MRKLGRQDVIPIDEYEKRRIVWRQHIIELKQIRRVSVGPNISIVFENRDTALFQIQEMLRTEHITDPELVDDEIATYNELIPDAAELRATLFIELPDADNVARDLPRFIGVEEQVAIVFGERVVKGEAEPGRSTEEKTATVHYLRFPFGPEDLRAFGSGPAQIVIDHPGYKATAELSEPVIASLKADLEAD